jgi:hypothetical protein
MKGSEMKAGYEITINISQDAKIEVAVKEGEWFYKSALVFSSFLKWLEEREKYDKLTISITKEIMKGGEE